MSIRVPEKVEVLVKVIVLQVNVLLVTYVVPLHALAAVVLFITGAFGKTGSPLTSILAPLLCIADVGSGATRNCDVTIKSNEILIPFGKEGDIETLKLPPKLFNVTI